MKAEWDYVQGAIDVTIRLNEATEPCSTGKWVFDGAFQMGVAEGKRMIFQHIGSSLSLLSRFSCLR